LKKYGLSDKYTVYIGTYRKEGDLLSNEIEVLPFEGIIFKEG